MFHYSVNFVSGRNSPLGIAGSHKIIALIHRAAKFDPMVLFHRVIPCEVVILMDYGWWQFVRILDDVIHLGTHLLVVVCSKK
jgi:hypothetical protein